MLMDMNNWLLWLRAAHVITIIAWMAGLFYLPRLFVYHATVPATSDKSALFKIMEDRLLRYIMTPALVGVVVTGLLLAYLLQVTEQPWFMVKFACALGLIAFHFALSGWTRAFAEDRNVHTARFFRIANEIPTVLMIVIVVMAIVKPI
jgi:protoporphyrinogen IX oxidase